MLPVEMPSSVEAFIRFSLHCTGTEYLENPDDMEVLAWLLYWFVATLLIAFALAKFKGWLSRYLVARRSGEKTPKMPFSVTLIASLLALLAISDFGWYLQSPFTTYPLHIPSSVSAIIRLWLSVTGQGSKAGNEGDMLDYVMNLYWAVATLLIGAPVLLCCLAIRRFIHKKTP
ncbi:hypothetical protein [Paraburkholderia aromaticivorans]|uniref:hypothetical protein n=1 Tax=Paraburkholderia aromaticivorans TaxID=2026199 RepID=UPI001F105127|nr:hypothetical protein [Paraburkholderia aromaticivorans]